MKRFFAVFVSVLCFATAAFASPADDKLFSAIEAGDMAGVRAAIDAGADLNAIDQESYHTPLRAAVRNKQFEIARELVDRGADIDAGDDVGETAFLSAATLPGSSELLRYLKDKGADIRVAIDQMGGALEYAAAYNPDMDVIRTLVDMGLDKEEGGANSEELMDACYIAAYRTNPNPEVIRYFIDRGANIYARDFDDDPAWGGWRIEQNIDRLAWLRENGFFVPAGVTFLFAPEDGQEPSDAWRALGEPVKVLPSAREDGAGHKIRFVSDQTAVVELQAGSWNDRQFNKTGTIFSETVSAGKVYEFTAPIMPDMPDMNDSGYFLIFKTNDEDGGTVDWPLHEDGYGGRHYRIIWRVDYTVG